VEVFAEPTVRLSGKIRLSGVDRDHFDRCLVNQQVQFASARLADARLDHDPSLDQIGSREQANRIGLYRAAEGVRIRLVEQDGENRGGVEHHQRGRPRSS
jgi:hypothetical protein